METYHSRLETTVTAEKEYLSEITFNNEHHALEFLPFKRHTPKQSIKDHLSEQDSGIHVQRL